MTLILSPQIRLRVLAARLGRRVRSALPGRRTTYVSQRVEEYRAYWSEGASAIGASFDELFPGFWEVRRGGQRTQLANFVTQCDDPVILRLAGDKAFGYKLATVAGVPVPEHRVVTLATLKDAELFRRQIQAPLVVKPAAGSSSGLGVTTKVRTSRELASAVALASLYDDRILVERMVMGESYRLLYLAGHLVHAVRRRGIRITGDGHATVSALLRRTGQASLEHDPIVHHTLAVQRLTMASVPLPAAEILVRGVPARSNGKRELRTVYDESVVNSCGEELVREGAKVVRGLGSELAGVDLITTNPSTSLAASGGAFIEINTTPGIHHHYVSRGDHHITPVAAKVLEHLLARGASCGAS